MERITKTISNWLAAAACVVLVVLMLITFFDVVGRYFFDAPLTFAVELIGLNMGLLVFFGLAITTLNRGHIAVDLVSAASPPAIRRFLARIAAIAGSVFIALMAWRLWDRAGNFMSDGLVTDILAFPIYPIVMIMSATAGFTVVIAVYQIFFATDQAPQAHFTPDEEA
ncbi:TRAP transporter small permease [Pseudahrensia aquimaris]|uniref:TRAP transporter small permease protein n=1 Tax=Pseudahrensia aquimaris TaxID=744461 RepID=A0ABW3FD18_9HYPH